MNSTSSKKNNQKLQKEGWYLFSIVSLAIMLIASLFLFLQNPFTTNLPTSSGLKPLGEMVNIVVSDNGSNSQSLYFYGSLLPEFDITQDTSITLKANQEECRVRAKVFMFDEDGMLMPLVATSASDWIYNADGYFYLDQNLTPSLTVKFLKTIQTPPHTAGLNSSNIYSVIISIETLPITSNYNTIWKLI